jgi:single-strand DNA-binding protein
MNVVVLHGTLTRVPEVRVLASGERLVAYELRVRRGEGRAESVPVVWPDPPAAAANLAEGAAVVVVGRVRRRFFRTGGATQSRTEVVADAVVGASQRARVRTAMGRAVAALEEAPP